MKYDLRLQHSHQINDFARFDPIDTDVYSYPIPKKDAKVKILQITPQAALLQTLGIVLNMCLVKCQGSQKTYYVYEDDLIPISSKG